MSEKRAGFNRQRAAADAIGGHPQAVGREAPVLLAGPTASGKSALALEIADRVGGVRSSMPTRSRSSPTGAS
jgi:DNA helicase TIP49 (TBP-interacting protein)